MRSGELSCGLLAGSGSFSLLHVIEGEDVGSGRGSASGAVPAALVDTRPASCQAMPYSSLSRRMLRGTGGVELSRWLAWF